jgi:hypothetical protein
MLRLPKAIERIIFCPPPFESLILKSMALEKNPHEIMGCAFSSALSIQENRFPVTLGQVSRQQTIRHYLELNKLGIRSAELRWREEEIPSRAIQNFRAQFGTYYRTTENALEIHDTTGYPINL